MQLKLPRPPAEEEEEEALALASMVVPAALAFAYAVLRQSPRHFKFLRAEFREIPYLARMALEVQPGASKAPPVLSYVGENCASDKGLVLTSVKNWPASLQYADPKLQKDKEVVLEAVRADGMALEFASAEFQADKDIVLAAIRTSGLALQFAGEDLKEDKEVVREATQMHWGAWAYAGPCLRSNKEFVLQVARTQDKIKTDFNNDPDFRKAVDCAVASAGGEGIVVMVWISRSLLLEDGHGGLHQDQDRDRDRDRDSGPAVGIIGDEEEVPDKTSISELRCEACLMSGRPVTFFLTTTADIAELAATCRDKLRKAKADLPRQIRLHLTLMVGDDEFIPISPFDAPRRVLELVPGFTSLDTQASRPDSDQDGRMPRKAQEDEFPETHGLGVAEKSREVHPSRADFARREASTASVFALFGAASRRRLRNPVLGTKTARVRKLLRDEGGQALAAH